MKSIDDSDGSVRWVYVDRSMATRIVRGPASSSREARTRHGSGRLQLAAISYPASMGPNLMVVPSPKVVSAQTSSGTRTCLRNASKDRASRRDTCICEIPTRSAI